MAGSGGGFVLRSCPVSPGALAARLVLPGSEVWKADSSAKARQRQGRAASELGSKGPQSPPL